MRLRRSDTVKKCIELLEHDRPNVDHARDLIRCLGEDADTVRAIASLEILGLIYKEALTDLEELRFKLSARGR